MKISFNKWLPYAIILSIFIVASCLYFLPALEGKVIYAGDSVNGIAATQEGVNFQKETGEHSFWTGSMFSGMPNYQIGGNGGFIIDKIMKPINTFFSWGVRNTALLFLFYLCSFFLLLRTFNINRWISMAGAFATSLSSYFFIIIAAQHHGKCYSITWMTIVVIGFLLIYRKQYGWGALLTMLFTYIGFFLHPQMSYYICLMIGIFFFAELAIAYKNKEWKHFGIASSIFAISFLVGLGMGSAKVFSNNEYAQETMRGGHSDLVKETDDKNKTEGLDLDYATAWSYGINETMTFLIPNYMGGASGYNLGKDSQLEQDLKKMGISTRQAKQFCQSVPTYRGDKAFTSGPVYMGAIVCFLFLLGLLIVKGPYKWALLVATLFSIALAWGRHFIGLTELFFEYFPMYNKFRAVESILVVAEITIPLLGFLAIKEISTKNESWEKLRNNILIAGGITGTICLITAIFSGTIDVTSSYDIQWKQNVGEQIYNAILEQRKELISSDAWRSLFFILMGTGVIFWYAYSIYHSKDSKKVTLYTGLALMILIVADMWIVNKRFCNDEMFVSTKDRDKAFKMLPYEKELLKDPDHFRVLNLTTNTFNEARTSYYLKSIGGYHAAKLRRYQDMIDNHIAPEMNPLMQVIMQTQGFSLPDSAKGNDFPVLNMLNMKYAIVPLQNGEQIAVNNPYAMGNCWLVDSLLLVNTPNKEIEALKFVDLHRIAILDTSYVKGISIEDNVSLSRENEEYIKLTKYQPNKITYDAHLKQNRLAIFSEIYYPHGWHLYTLNKEGKRETEIPLIRTNYILRGAIIPNGTHSLEMVFEPEAVKMGNILSLICFGIFCLTTICVLIMYYKRKKIDSES